MDILHLIDRLEELAGEARRLPVGGGAVVSRQRLLDLVDRMRVAVPREVYDARELLEKQEEVLSQPSTQQKLKNTKFAAKNKSGPTGRDCKNCGGGRTMHLLAG